MDPPLQTLGKGVILKTSKLHIKLLFFENTLLELEKSTVGSSYSFSPPADTAVNFVTKGFLVYDAACKCYFCSSEPRSE